MNEDLSKIVMEFPRIAQLMTVEADPGACSFCHATPDRLMKVPKLGRVCPVLCAEMLIWNEGCAWCGEEPPKGERHCGHACKLKSNENPVGNGKRLVSWLIDHARWLFNQPRPEQNPENPNLENVPFHASMESVTYTGTIH